MTENKPSHTHIWYHSWNESISKINQQIVLGRRCCVVFGDGVPCHMFIKRLIFIYYIDTYTAYITVYPLTPLTPLTHEWVFISSTQRAMWNTPPKALFSFFILGGILSNTLLLVQLDKTNTGWIQLFPRKMDALLLNKKFGIERGNFITTVVTANSSKWMAKRILGISQALFMLDLS